MKKELNRGYFRLARNISRFSDCAFCLGAVISKKTPISVGFNIIRTHPKYSNPSTMNTVSIHAEMMALYGSGEDVKGYDIYIYRETTDGTPALAFPCESCYNTLKKCGIKKVYYTIGEYPYWKCEKL